MVGLVSGEILGHDWSRLVFSKSDRYMLSSFGVSFMSFGGYVP